MQRVHENDSLINKYLDRKDPVVLDQLTKKFGNTKAVDDLSISVRMNEVFTILGHNGAGKTTALYMLTGVLKPTSGDANVYGYSILDNLDFVQQRLGLC